MSRRPTTRQLFFNAAFVVLAGAGIVLSFASGHILAGLLFVIVATLKATGVVRVEWGRPQQPKHLKIELRGTPTEGTYIVTSNGGGCWCTRWGGESIIVQAMPEGNQR